MGSAQKINPVADVEAGESVYLCKLCGNRVRDPSLFGRSWCQGCMAYEYPVEVRRTNV